MSFSLIVGTDATESFLNLKEAMAPISMAEMNNEYDQFALKHFLWPKFIAIPIGAVIP